MILLIYLINLHLVCYCNITKLIKYFKLCILHVCKFCPKKIKKLRAILCIKFYYNKFEKKDLNVTQNIINLLFLFIF